MKSEEDPLFLPIAITYVFLLLLGIFYFSFLQNIITIPVCPIYSYLGFPCPACGMTRATYALVNGDFISSISYNPTIFYFVFATPIYLFMQCLHRFFHVKFSIPFRYIFYVGLGIMLIFWITGIVKT